jgi:hypothetical protein
LNDNRGAEQYQVTNSSIECRQLRCDTNDLKLTITAVGIWESPKLGGASENVQVYIYEVKNLAQAAAWMKGIWRTIEMENDLRFNSEVATSWARLLEMS